MGLIFLRRVVYNRYDDSPAFRFQSIAFGTRHFWLGPVLLNAGILKSSPDRTPGFFG